jgi:hypothetical protein
VILCAEPQGGMSRGLRIETGSGECRRGCDNYAGGPWGSPATDDADAKNSRDQLHRGGTGCPATGSRTTEAPAEQGDTKASRSRLVPVGLHRGDGQDTTIDMWLNGRSVARQGQRAASLLRSEPPRTNQAFRIPLLRATMQSECYTSSSEMQVGYAKVRRSER